ncbi:MAG: hypothetical protein QNJ36_09075 [Calothrix sp. MO_167.B42]|nr:hypothetical protein [Calothrix sp. MO_167.B42]
MIDFDLRTWDLVARKTYKGKPIAGTSNWEQIPIQFVSIKYPLCVVKIQNKYAAGNWKHGGKVTVLTQGVKLTSQSVELNLPTLVKIDELANNYQLKFWFPWWHAQIILEVWQKVPQAEE